MGGPFTTAYPPLLRAVAAHGLPGSMLDMPARPLDDAAFLHLNSAVREQKLTGLLWAAISEGDLPATPVQREWAEESHVQMLAGTLVLEGLLLDVTRMLRSAGIESRVLKGPAVAHLDYPQVGLRVYGDVDLLVTSADFDRTVAALVEVGCTRRFPEPRPGFDRQFGKGTSLLTPDGLEIDLHRTFTMGPYGARLDLDGLWARGDSLRVGQDVLTCLATEERLLHAAYHTVLGDRRPRLVPMRDLAQIVLTQSLDRSRLASVMRASGGEAVVARAVRETWSALALADVLSITAWAQERAEDRRSAAELAMYGANSSYATRSLGTVRALTGWGARARYLAAMALPDGSYLADRHSGRLDRLRHGMRDIKLAREPR